MNNSTLVVGGGWAGLSAAVELTRQGEAVTLLEAAPQLGGRARSVALAGGVVDNGQHLVIGAYRETLRLLAAVGVSEAAAFRRHPMDLPLLGGDGHSYRLSLNRHLPAPLNLLWALLRLRGYTLRERAAALRLALALKWRGFRLPEEVSVLELLRTHRQPQRLIDTLWGPLCLATLNTPVAAASATLFLNVLRDSFSHRARDADLLLARAPLGRLFPQPAAAYLQRHGAVVETSARVTGLVVEGGQVRGVRVGGRELAASRVVLATPPEEARRLLEPHPATADLAAGLAGLNSAPITTVYLRYPRAVALPTPMEGWVAGLGHWLTDQALRGEPQWLSVVISGDGPHMAMGREELGVAVAREVAAHHPHLAEPLAVEVIRERRATFHAGVGVQARRPQAETPVTGLWLAGDYVLGPYPSTLEGAVHSGVQCARLVLAERRRGKTE